MHIHSFTRHMPWRTSEMMMWHPTLLLRKWWECQLLIKSRMTLARNLKIAVNPSFVLTIVMNWGNGIWIIEQRPDLCRLHPFAVPCSTFFSPISSSNLDYRQFGEEWAFLGSSQEMEESPGAEGAGETVTVPHPSPPPIATIDGKKMAATPPSASSLRWSLLGRFISSKRPGARWSTVCWAISIA